MFPINRDSLDPWRVVCACLFDQSSFEIPKILDHAGLAVDWSLDAEQNYSEKYRKAAYRPSINCAYEALSNQDKLRVAYIVASELDRRGQADALNVNLDAIGWAVEGGKLTPTNTDVRELFFSVGTQHDAYVEIRAILKNSTTSVTVVDPYLDGTIFSLLSTVAGTVRTIKLLTSGSYPSDFPVEANKFRLQYSGVTMEVRRSRDFHDRFLVLDDAQCWHIGASIKDAGGKAFMISCVEDEKNRLALVSQLLDAWNNASVCAI